LRDTHRRIEARRNPAGLAHTRKGVQKILVDRITLAVDALLLRHLVFEPLALLGHIDELAEAVRNLNPAGVKLEALGEPWLAAFRPGERRLHRRIFAKDGRPPLPEARFDLLD